MYSHVHVSYMYTINLTILWLNYIARLNLIYTSHTAIQFKIWNIKIDTTNKAITFNLNLMDLTIPYPFLKRITPLMLNLSNWYMYKGSMYNVHVVCGLFEWKQICRVFNAVVDLRGDELVFH